MIKYFKVIAKEDINEVPIRVPQKYKFTPGKEYIVAYGRFTAVTIYDDNMNGIEFYWPGRCSYTRRYPCYTSYFDYVEDSEEFVNNKKEMRQVLLNHYKLITGICAICGRIHLINPENKEWRFTCNNCGSYRVFIDQNVRVKWKNKLKYRYFCRCGEEQSLRHTGMGDDFINSIGFDYHECVGCGKKYEISHY
jgi:hypothetical protein